MKMYLVTKALLHEGDYPLGILSEDGLKAYLAKCPAYHDDGYEGYTTHQKGAYEWYDITPWTVDSLLEG